jgi:plasmid stabilization system protein ParE
MKIFVSERAERKLHETADYILEHFGQKSRLEFLQEFYHTANLLKNNPYMGVIEPLLAEFSSTYRSFVLKRRNKIIYRIIDDSIEIADLWDCRREPEALVRGLNT